MEAVLITLLILSHIAAALAMGRGVWEALSGSGIATRFMELSEYIVSGSPLRAALISSGDLEKNLLFEDIDRVGGVEVAEDPEIVVETAASDIELEIDRLEREVENLDVKAALISAVTVFPPLLALIATIPLGPWILLPIPILQALLTRILTRVAR